MTTTVESKGSLYLLKTERIWTGYTYEWMSTVHEGVNEVWRSDLHCTQAKATREGLNWLLARIRG